MWFRWWEGTVTDPKFQWVALKSGQSVAVVIAVWAALLEYASEDGDAGKRSVTKGNAGKRDVTQSNAEESNVTTSNTEQHVKQRGSIYGFDFESFDVLLGIEIGTSKKIKDTMEAKGLIEVDRITNWDKRQPKREDSSAGRVREHRDRKKIEQENSKSVTQCNAEKRDVTHGNARVEKSREDKNIKNKNHKHPPRKRGDVVADDVAETSGKSPQPWQRGDPLPDVATPEWLHAAWNDILPDYGIPRMRELTELRKKQFRDQLRENPDRASPAYWLEVFERITRSDFLLGLVEPAPGKKRFICRLSWLLEKKEALSRLMDGVYDNDNFNPQRWVDVPDDDDHAPPGEMGRAGDMGGAADTEGANDIPEDRPEQESDDDYGPGDWFDDMLGEGEGGDGT
jgi:hypothetical protein